MNNIADSVQFTVLLAILICTYLIGYSTGVYAERRRAAKSGDK